MIHVKIKEAYMLLPSTFILLLLSFNINCQKSMMILSLTSSILENSFILDYFTRLILCVSVITYITNVYPSGRVV